MKVLPGSVSRHDVNEFDATTTLQLNISVNKTLKILKWCFMYCTFKPMYLCNKMTTV